MRKNFPRDSLQAELQRIVGLPPEQQERAALRGLAYRMGLMPPIGANADELARMILDCSSGVEPNALHRLSRTTGQMRDV